MAYAATYTAPHGRQVVERESERGDGIHAHFVHSTHRKTEGKYV